MKLRLIIVLLVLAMVLPACSTLSYYHQAAMGQLTLLSKRRPIEVVIADPEVDRQIVKKLELARDVLQFAEHEVGLPVGDTFSSYADIDRDFLVWNVFVAAEFSSQLEVYCYPIAGCVGYKGFFARSDADSFAEAQTEAGFEVYVGGVAAYSTLGWFADPLVNTFIKRSDAALAALIFHELAHKVLYVQGDTVFNESFATTVERYALALWLAQQNQLAVYEQHLSSAERRAEVIRLILAARQTLTKIYKTSLPEAALRQAKIEEIAALRDAYQALRSGWQQGSEFSYWMQSDINNAKLAAIGAYQDYVPGFEVMLNQAGSFDEFIRRVTALSKLSPSEREQRLYELSEH